MIVLGITETHCATAAILRDGAIVGCASEERFTRLKNDAGYPRLAVDALLRELSLTPRDIDLVALAGTRAYARDWMNRVLHDADYAREYYGVRLEEPARGLGRRARHEAVPSAPGSLGSFYSFVPLLLGMKFGEHEYKVMGLAPYAPARQAERAHEALSAVFGLEATTPARFAWKRRGPRYRLLLETTLGLRFDAVAAGGHRAVGDAPRGAAGVPRRRSGGRARARG